MRLSTTSPVSATRCSIYSEDPVLSHQNAWRFRQKRTAKPPFLNFEQGLAWLSRRHGSDVVYHVAHETGIAIGTVQNWFRRRNGIRGDHQLATRNNRLILG